jgi:osmotically-inducible protein OsmY
MRATTRWSTCAAIRQPTVRTAQGVVHLSGVVRTEEAKHAAEKAAGGVAGVWEVESVSLAKSAVAMAVVDALAHDARTSQALIDVACLGGSVTLRGQIQSVPRIATWYGSCARGRCGAAEQCPRCLGH